MAISAYSNGFSFHSMHVYGQKTVYMVLGKETEIREKVKIHNNISMDVLLWLLNNLQYIRSLHTFDYPEILLSPKYKLCMVKEYVISEKNYSKLKEKITNIYQQIDKYNEECMEVYAKIKKIEERDILIFSLNVVEYR